MIRKILKYPFLTVKTNSRQEMYSKRAHSHKEVSLGYIESGKTLMSVKKREFLLLPGDVVLIPAETVHLCSPEDPELFRFQMFYFETEWWEEKIGSLFNLQEPLALPSDSNLKSVLLAISEGPGDSEVFEKNLTGSLRAISDSGGYDPAPGSSVDAGIFKVHEMIVKMPHISMSVDDMAETAGINKFIFIRKYARYFGLTPHADIVNMRIQRAILLFETEMDLASIALECGFSDQSHFSNQFRLYTGMSPNDYRASLDNY